MPNAISAPARATSRSSGAGRDAPREHALRVMIVRRRVDGQLPVGRARDEHRELERQVEALLDDAPPRAHRVPRRVGVRGVERRAPARARRSRRAPP
jgi:hypothetical protein